MKKTISNFMIFVMLSSFSVNVYAGENDFTNLVELGATQIIDAEVSSTNERYYVALYGDNQTIVTVEEQIDGVKYFFQEEMLEDELLILDNGKMYLNGKEVTVDEHSSTELVKQEKNINSPRAYYEWWELSDTKFASGSYTYGEYSEKYNYNLGQEIVKTTVGALATIIIARFFPSLATEAAEAADLITEGCSTYLTIMKAFAPESQTAYVKKTWWNNGNPSLDSNPLEYYFKIKIEYFKTPDYNASDSTGYDYMYGVQYIKNH